MATLSGRGTIKPKRGEGQKGKRTRSNKPSNDETRIEKDLRKGIIEISKDQAETGEATKLYVPNLTIRALRAEWWLGSKERHRMASTES